MPRICRWFVLLLALTLPFALAIAIILPPRPAAASTVRRIGGSDRYQTAVYICQAGWQSSSIVLLARGDDYADALAGVPLAHRLGAPILLTRPGDLPSAVLQEIQRLQASEVIILGGTAAVSPAVESQLKNLGLTVARIGGNNRFDTAARVAERFAPLDGVILVYGYNFPDALAAAAYAAQHGMPILLTDTNVIPPETRAAIQQSGYVFVVGGELAVSEKLFMSLDLEFGRFPVRISGADRYDTAVELAKHFAPPNKNMYAATGLQFPDAITGAVLAARNNTGILLVRDPLGETVERYIENYQVTGVTIFGGEAAVSGAVAGRIGSLIAGPPPGPSPGPPAPPTSFRVGFRVRGDRLYGLDHTSREVELCAAPSFLTAGDYAMDSRFNFFLLTAAGSLEFRGRFDYREQIPYLLMPLNTRAPLTVTAHFLNAAAQRLRAGCPLSNMGDSFIYAQETWGVNAVYLLAHAALESAWGTSAIARDKNNYFGFMAYDSNPYHSAATFQTGHDCVLYVSAYIRRAYLSEGGRYFRGPTLDGMNRYYATDPMWAVKIARAMQNIQPYAEGSTTRKERVWGSVNAGPLNLRRGPGIDAEVISTLSQGAAVEIHGLKVVGEGYWFKVQAGAADGWVSGQFVSLQGPAAGAVFFPNWYYPENKSLFLNVRSGPGIGHTAVGSLLFGEKVSITGMQMVDYVLWYRINHAGVERWVSGDYIIADW